MGLRFPAQFEVFTFPRPVFPLLRLTCLLRIVDVSDIDRLVTYVDED